MKVRNLDAVPQSLSELPRRERGAIGSKPLCRTAEWREDISVAENNQLDVPGQERQTPSHARKLNEMRG